MATRPVALLETNYYTFLPGEPLPDPDHQILRGGDEPALGELRHSVVHVLMIERPDDTVAPVLRLRDLARLADLIARGMEPGPAATLARMADGSYTRALDLAENEDLMATRQLVLDFFRLAYARNVDKLADLIDEMGKAGRERLKGMMGLMLVWMRDLMLFHAMGEEAPLVNVDQAEAVARFCRNLPDADLPAMVGLVEQAVELIERNVHVGLVLTVLAHALGRAMRGPHDGRLYVPLTETGPAAEPAGRAA